MGFLIPGLWVFTLMRIAVWHNLAAGGAKRHLFNHVKGLLARGHEVEAWCLSSTDRAYLPLEGLIQEHVVSLDWAPKWSRSLAINSYRTYYAHRVERMRSVDRACVRCADELRQGGFDLVYAANCIFATAPPLARHVAIPSVLFLQEPNRALYEAQPRQVWSALRGPTDARRAGLIERIRDYVETQGNRMAVRFEHDNAAAFDRILVNSYFSRESVLRAYGLDAEVCHIGIDTERFCPATVDREDFVLSVGAFAPHKNAELVIESVSRLAAPRPLLVWVGASGHEDYKVAMRAMAKAKGVELDLQCGVSDEDLISLMRRAALMIFAPRLEPFGMAPLEAGACGCPVVGIAEGGIRETITDGVNGLLVDAKPGAIAEAAARILSDREFARNLGMSAREHNAARWGIEASIDRIERQCMDVCEKSSRRSGP